MMDVSIITSYPIGRECCTYSGWEQRVEQRKHRRQRRVAGVVVLWNFNTLHYSKGIRKSGGTLRTIGVSWPLWVLWSMNTDLAFLGGHHHRGCPGILWPIPPERTGRRGYKAKAQVVRGNWQKGQEPCTCSLRIDRGEKYRLLAIVWMLYRWAIPCLFLSWRCD